jgi:hypothetical protein
VAIWICGTIEPSEERIVRIRNTLDLRLLWISRAILEPLAEQVVADGGFRRG